MKTIEWKQSVKDDLKKAGYNTREVSVREQDCGYSRALTITVRDASVSLKNIQEIASRHESIDRCERTGEILSGGNRYIDVELKEEIKEQYYNMFKEEVSEAMDNIEEKEGQKFF